MADRVPAEMADAHMIRALGLVVSVADYEDLPAVTRDDLVQLAECDQAKRAQAARVSESQSRRHRV